MPDMDGFREANNYGFGQTSQFDNFHVKGASNLPWGMKDRLSRIFNPKTGRAVMLAFDHGFIMGPTSGLERIDLRSRLRRRRGQSRRPRRRPKTRPHQPDHERREIKTAPLPGGVGSAKPRLRGCHGFATAGYLRRPYLFSRKRKDRGEKSAWTRLVRAASEFR